MLRPLQPIFAVVIRDQSAALHFLTGGFAWLYRSSCFTCSQLLFAAYLTETQERHGPLIGNALESVRRYLFKSHFQFQQARLLHPKLTKLLPTVAQWTRTPDQEAPRHPVRILLLLSRCPHDLYKEIAEALGTLPSARVALYDGAEGASSVVELLTTRNVVATALSSITARFPWSEFDFVVEYEHVAGAAREDLYAGNGRLKQHLAFRSCCDKSAESRVTSQSTRKGLYGLRREGSRQCA